MSLGGASGHESVKQMQRGGHRDKISHRAARPCERLPEHLEGPTRLRGGQSHYNRLKAPLHKEMQVKRKVAPGAELRNIESGIDQNRRKRELPEPSAGLR